MDSRDVITSWIIPALGIPKATNFNAGMDGDRFTTCNWMALALRSHSSLSLGLALYLAILSLSRPKISEMEPRSTVSHIMRYFPIRTL